MKQLVYSLALGASLLFPSLETRIYAQEGEGPEIRYTPISQRSKKSKIIPKGEKIILESPLSAEGVPYYVSSFGGKTGRAFLPSERILQLNIAEKEGAKKVYCSVAGNIISSNGNLRIRGSKAYDPQTRRFKKTEEGLMEGIEISVDQLQIHVIKNREKEAIYRLGESIDTTLLEGPHSILLEDRILSPGGMRNVYASFQSNDFDLRVINGLSRKTERGNLGYKLTVEKDKRGNMKYTLHIKNQGTSPIEVDEERFDNKNEMIDVKLENRGQVPLEF